MAMEVLHSGNLELQLDELIGFRDAVLRRTNSTNFELSFNRAKTTNPDICVTLDPKSTWDVSVESVSRQEICLKVFNGLLGKDDNQPKKWSGMVVMRTENYHEWYCALDRLRSGTKTHSPSGPLASAPMESWTWINDLRTRIGLPLLEKNNQSLHPSVIELAQGENQMGKDNKSVKKQVKDYCDDEEDEDYESDRDEQYKKQASTSEALFAVHKKKATKIKSYEEEFVPEVEVKTETPQGIDRFAKHSLLCLSKTNPLRKVCISLELDAHFHQFVFVLILYNSVLLGIGDYNHVITNPASPKVGEFDTQSSDRNYVIMVSEAPLALLYAAEMVIRVVAMGFRVYIADYWNILDFVVSVAGLIQLGFTNSPVKLTFLRTFRVLRPLRFIQRLKGLKVLVQSTIQVQLFGGVVHARCRLTPYPVTLDWHLGAEPSLYRCKINNSTVSTFTTTTEKPEWRKQDSPWSTPQRQCFWPVDSEDERVCDLYQGNYKSGKHVCAHHTHWLNSSEWRWCGSNYDALGNDRFGVSQNGPSRFVKHFNASFTSREMNSVAGTYTESYNWALTTFDSFPSSFVTIFQIITLEGWIVVTYMVMDGAGPATAFFFIILVMLGSIFILNLVLAVLESNFTESREAEKLADEERQRLGAGLSLEDYDDDGKPIVQKETQGLAASAIVGRFANKLSIRSKSTQPSGLTKVQFWIGLKFTTLKNWGMKPPKSQVRIKVEAFCGHHLFDKFILCLIIANTVVLACDRYPISDSEAKMLELMNLGLTLMFTLEMLLKCLGMGFWIYLADIQNTLDALIVVTSLIELAIAPPAALGGKESKGGVITALRCMRLFRIFKMAKKWKAMNDLMTRFLKTIADVSYVALLMMLLLYIFVLLGMQLFANLLRFDAYGYPIKIGEAGWANADIPRTNFDTFSWAFVTVFCVLTGENWNSVMYDCWRAVGPSAVVYFLGLLVLGMFVVLNLFLAVLLSNFSDVEEGEPKEQHIEDAHEDPSLESTHSEEDRLDSMDRTNEEDHHHSRHLKSQQTEKEDRHRNLYNHEYYDEEGEMTNYDSDNDEHTSKKKPSESDKESVIPSPLIGLNRKQSSKNWSKTTSFNNDNEDEEDEDDNEEQDDDDNDDDDNYDDIHDDDDLYTDNNNDGDPIEEDNAAVTAPRFSSMGGGFGLSHLSLSPEAMEARKKLKRERSTLKTKFLMPGRCSFGDDEKYVSGAGVSSKVQVVSLKPKQVQFGSISLSHSILIRIPVLRPLSEAAFFLERTVEFGGDIREMEARKGLNDVLRIINNATHISKGMDTLDAEIYRLNELGVYHAKQCRYTSAIALSSKNAFEEVHQQAREFGVSSAINADAKDETSDENFELSLELKRASTYMAVSMEAAKHAQLQHDTILRAIQDNENLLRERKDSLEQITQDAKSMLAWVTRAALIGQAKMKDRASHKKVTDHASESDSSETSQERKLRKMDSVYPLQEGYTLFLFSVKSPTRLLCAYICSMPLFEQTTMVFIFLSSVALAIDSPLMDPASDLRYVLQLSDLFFTAYFVFEMVVKVVTYGFWFMPKAYLKDGFNALDFFIVVSGLLSLWEGGGVLFKSLRALRALRSLRPLRIIKRFDSLKIVVNALLNVIPDVVNVLLLCLLFFIMFGVIFVQNLKGEFSACQGDEFDRSIAGTDKETFLVNPKPWAKMTETQQGWFGGVGDGPQCDHWQAKDIPTSKMVCQCLGAEWSAITSQNFDNINNALWTLYELSTTEGWLDVAIAAVDARGIDKQPVRDYNVVWAFCFIVFMFTGSFFFMNLFVGVLYERFVQAQCDLEGGRNYLTKEQEEYIVAQRLSIRFKPVPKIRIPKNNFRLSAYHMVTHFAFEVAILSCIVLNSIVMALSFFGENDVYGSVLESCNLVFAAIFTLEAVAKLLAFGRQYFSDWWNCFDLSIVIGTMFGIIVTLFSAGGGGGFIVALRAFRLARILRIIQGAEALQEMINTLIFTLAGLVNVMGLLFLLFFVYTVMGVQLFSKIAYNGDLDVHANFRTFGSAMLTLFRFATGENWNGFMYNVAEAGGDVPGGCVADPPYDINMCGFNNRPGCAPMTGCGSDAIFFYLYSFIMVAFFVALNLFVGVILDAFQNANESGRMFRLSDMEHFQAAWSQYDQAACGFIDTLDLLHLIQHLPQPWGFGGVVKATQYQVRQRIAALGLPIYAPGSSVFYYDVFFALTAAVILEKEKKIRKAEEAEAKRKQSVFDEVERRRQEAKERHDFLSKLTAWNRKTNLSNSFQSSHHLGSGRGSPLPFGSFQATLGDEDDDEINTTVRLNSGESNGVGIFEASEDSSSSDSLSRNDDLSEDDETVDPITEMIDGKAADSFNKMRKAVSILCKRHAMRDHEGNRLLTASDDYAARFIQKKYVIYLKNKREKEKQGRLKGKSKSRRPHHIR